MSCPCKVTELVPGQLVAGFIVKVDTYGVLVRFRDALTALVPRPNIADKVYPIPSLLFVPSSALLSPSHHPLVTHITHICYLYLIMSFATIDGEQFVATPAGLFHEGDAVRCVVQRVDLERERVIATFKATAVPPSQGHTCFLSALLRENYLTAKYNSATSNNTSNSTSLIPSAPSSSSSSKMLEAWRSFHVSQVVQATVTSVEAYGVVLLAPDQVTDPPPSYTHHIYPNVTHPTKTALQFTFPSILSYPVLSYPILLCRPDHDDVRKRR